MSAVTSETIKELRERTSAGIMDCKQALSESNGDLDKAIEFLRKKGMDKATKKSGRAANDGLVTSYIHMGGKIGVLLEVNCETDFVARTEDFASFVKEVAMQIAATNPQYVSSDEVPQEFIEKEKEILRAQVQGKPEEVIEKILQGKIEKKYEEICLLNQKYIKDDSKTIKEMVTEIVAKIGENIIVRRFARFELGAE